MCNPQSGMDGIQVECIIHIINKRFSLQVIDGIKQQVDPSGSVFSGKKCTEPGKRHKEYTSQDCKHNNQLKQSKT